MVTDIKSSKFALAVITTISGLTFFSGTQYNRIDQLFTKAYAAEAEQRDTKHILYDIHGKVCAIEQDVKNIRSKVDA